MSSRAVTTTDRETRKDQMGRIVQGMNAKRLKYDDLIAA